jgi:multidrug efflux pump subunit AcrA (membrane-fusion protein)
MKRFLLIPVVLAAAVAVWYFSRSAGPPEVSVERPQRVDLKSVLTTNGKVEPGQSAWIRASRSGRVLEVPAVKGQAVRLGQPIVVLDSADLQPLLSSAEARTSEAQANLQVVQDGGKKAEWTAIENSLTAQRQLLNQAQADLPVLKRLKDRNAATGQQVIEVERRIEQIQTEIASLERRRATLVQETDRVVAEARIRAAEADADQARVRIQQGRILSPMAGVLYQFDVKPGAYLNAGDPVGAVGKLDPVKVAVYVDEPDLGKVQLGTRVVVTWDAYPGRTWEGTVDRLATQVMALGTRQVGEVLITTANGDGSLLPGTNINAEIPAASVAGALTIPRSALRRKDNQDGVLVVDPGNTLRFRPIKIGVSSATRFQVLEGLTESDRVLMPTDLPVGEGSVVRVKP